MQAKDEIAAAERPELIFALVGPAGVRLDDLSQALKDHLKAFGYKAFDIRLSNLLNNFTGRTEDPASEYVEFTRITHGQEMGNKFRRTLKDGAALARAGIAAIREQRTINSKGHAPREVRVKGLSELMAAKDNRPGDQKYREKAEHIIEIDQKEDDDLGQNTRDTYPLADFIANLTHESGEKSVTRFIDLLFGHPFHTPSPEEYAMYQARAVALRSSDEGRQVGAVIVEPNQKRPGMVTNVDIVASGMNEVPRRGGGFYWHNDSPERRDQWLLAKNEDRAEQIKISALVELIDKIRKKEWLKETVSNLPPNDLAYKLLPDLKRTQFMDIGEFMRPVHAEMAALIDSARRGVAVNNCHMYVTSFPCHNCAKHIIAAGLRRVVYLEPYPKSRADFLHKEEINLEYSDGVDQDERVVFLAFSGIAPRQYQQVFSMSARGAKKGLALNQWTAQRTSLSPRYVTRNASEAYVLAERQELEMLRDDVYKWDKNAVCPTLR